MKQCMLHPWSFFFNWLSSLLWGLVKPLDQPCVSTCLFTYYMPYTRLVNHFSFSNFKMLGFYHWALGERTLAVNSRLLQDVGSFFFATSRPCCQPVIIWHSFFLDCGLYYAWSYFWHTSIKHNIYGERWLLKRQLQDNKGGTNAVQLIRVNIGIEHHIIT